MDIAKASLVIDARKVESLAIDGPALRIGMVGQSPRLFPFRRLSRINITGHLNKGLDALLQCAEQQIPVAFYTTAGKLRCQLYFPVYENSLLSHWLDHVEFDPQACEVYEEWKHLQRLHMLSLMGYRNGSREDRSRLVEESLRHICREALGERKMTEALEWMEGMLSAHLSQIIVQHGLSNHGRSKRKLMEDIQPICHLWLLRQLAETVSRNKGFRITANTMSDLYHEQSEMMEYTVRRMLTQLASRLEAIV